MTAEIEQRLPVWTALSELYLDSELDEADLVRIARTLSQSPYGRAEIERILRDEVAPVFTPNLLSVAGEWTPWSEADVEEIMRHSLKKRASGWLGRIRHRLRIRIIPEEWHEIAVLIE